jgi:putative membrane protein insertion efficiency factor
MSALRAIAIAPIRLYQRALSPTMPQRCKYYPTCSEYAIGAVRQYGVLRGVVLAGWRLLRCNPLSNGGFDYVEDQKVFRSRAPAHRC